MARTLYSCKAENPSELSFEANQFVFNGEIRASTANNCQETMTVRITMYTEDIMAVFVVCVVHTSNEPGWLDGTIDGQSGLIPANYIEYIDCAPPSALR